MSEKKQDLLGGDRQTETDKHTKDVIMGRDNVFISVLRASVLPCHASQAPCDTRVTTVGDKLPLK